MFEVIVVSEAYKAPSKLNSFQLGRQVLQLIHGFNVIGCLKRLVTSFNDSLTMGKYIQKEQEYYVSNLVWICIHLSLFWFASSSLITVLSFLHSDWLFVIMVHCSTCSIFFTNKTDHVSHQCIATSTMESFFYKFANQYVTMAKNSYGLFEYFCSHSGCPSADKAFKNMDALACHMTYMQSYWIGPRTASVVSGCVKLAYLCTELLLSSEQLMLRSRSIFSYFRWWHLGCLYLLPSTIVPLIDLNFFKEYSTKDRCQIRWPFYEEYWSENNYSSIPYLRCFLSTQIL